MFQSFKNSRVSLRSKDFHLKFDLGDICQKYQKILKQVRLYVTMKQYVIIHLIKVTKTLQANTKSYMVVKQNLALLIRRLFS